MQDSITVNGIVLKAMPVGEYDKVLTILTKERGKVSAFARGARRMNSRMMAAANPFCFGSFRLYPGRNAYTVAEATITNYFDELHQDPEEACYGMYFLEVADYYTRENNDEAQMLLLLYQTLRALVHPNFRHDLVRAVYECRAMVVNGEFPGVPQNRPIAPAAEYAIRVIESAPLEKLYSFTLSEEALQQLREVSSDYCRKIWNHSFKSLAILQEFHS